MSTFKTCSLVTAIALFVSSSLLPQYADAASRYSRSSYDRGVSSAAQKSIDKLDDDKDKHFPIPILIGVSPSQISDTWGDARSQGRTHEGNDIFAPRNSFVVSPTDAVVTSIVKEDDDNKNTLGGNYVYTANPGGERFYYAHLDHFAEGLKVGKVLKPGDLIGYVGNSGNAAGGSTHLHFGIYEGREGAVNPYERLTEEFSTKQRIQSLGKIADNMDHEDEAAALFIANYAGLFAVATAQKIEIPSIFKDALKKQKELIKTQIPPRDLSVGMQGDDVAWLQNFLISQNKGVSAQALASAGATGLFGTITKNALVEYQAASGILPANGIFGPITKAYLLSH